jgi:hypothetical protein
LNHFGKRDEFDACGVVTVEVAAGVAATMIGDLLMNVWAEEMCGQRQ